MYICMYVRVCVCVCVHVRTYGGMYVCMYVCTFVCMHVCTYLRVLQVCTCMMFVEMESIHRLFWIEEYMGIKAASH